MSGGAVPWVLVACIGNPDRGDDGAGALVAAHLARAAVPGLMVSRYADGLLGLLDDWRGVARVICVDAVAPLGAPGTIHVIDPARESLPRLAPATSTHGVGLAEVIRLARALDALPADLVIYGIEGERFDPGTGPSQPVQCAAAHVAAMIVAAVGRETTQPAG